MSVPYGGWGGKGVLSVVGTERFRFGGGKEEGSGGIGWRGDNKQGGGNDPGKDNEPGMRAGLQSSNLTYYRDRV